MTAQEYEWESELEAEWESEGEWEEEAEWEMEAEAEAFFGRLAGLARRAVASPALRRVGLQAARGALSGLRGVGSSLGRQIGGARGAALGGDLGATLGRHVSGWLPQSEMEMEGEYEVNPIRRVYPEALMEHLGHEAAEVESEAEAEAFLGALVPLAARLIPRAAPAIMRVAPNLIRGVAGVARTLRSNPATRPLVRALPTVVRQTTANLARQAQQGRPVTPQTAVRALASQTSRVIGNPQASVRAFQRSRALDRRFHAHGGGSTVSRPPAGRPALRPHPAGGVN